MQKILAKPAYYHYDQIIFLYDFIVYDLIILGERYGKHK